MFKAVVGHSNDPDSLSAVEEVLQQCTNSLAGDIPKAGILFAAIDFEHSFILQQIHQAFPGIELIGGTTDGEISSVLEFYHHYLGLLPPSMEYPLAVFDHNGENFYIRAPIAYNQESGSITFFGDIPDQAVIQISEAAYEDILAASKASFMNALDNYPGAEPSAVLFFSCVARRQILGTRAQEEYQNTKLGLANYFPACGFYSYGEIAPVDRISQTQFHNETFVTLILGSR